MFIDLLALEDSPNLEADICIVGAGPAGISMARSFLGTNIDVLVLESGGFEYDSATQELCDGENVGLNYFDLMSARLRYLGGSSNHWDNWCGELQPIDYAKRPWVPYSGWPFGPSEMKPWYDLARPLCSLAPRQTVEEIWSILNLDPLALDESRVSFNFWEIAPATHFGKVYRRDLEKAPNVRVLLHANVTELNSDEFARTVKSLSIRTIDGRRAKVKARVFVLACGGIENPRLMLASDRVEPHGIGNSRGLVGRFFMEHPRDRIGRLTTHDPMALIDLFRPGWSGMQSYCPAIVVSDEKAKEEEILNHRIELRYEGDDPAMSAMRQLGTSLSAGRLPNQFSDELWDLIRGADIVAYNLYRRAFQNRPMVPRPELVREIYLVAQAEQAPNPASRVTLSDRRDALGVRLPVLDWRFTELEKKTVQVQTQMLGAELSRLGVGLLRIDPWLMEDDASWTDDMVGGYHHIGTTRMSEDPNLGVVDADCKVHGLNNLYIAGSSVFPTAGNINPTLTLVALALRLADHLKVRLA